MRRMHTIAVKHNIEVAHRLFMLPGKCEQIHGHSMWVTLEIEGELNAGGILNGIEYGDLKKLFRGHLDAEYDHRLLLNQDDPFAKPVFTFTNNNGIATMNEGVKLPGLQVCPGDPTTENIANWILGSTRTTFIDLGIMSDVKALEVTVWETAVNMSTAFEDYEG